MQLFFVLHFFFGRRCHLPLLYPFGVFLLEQDLKGKKNQLAVQQKRIIFNIGQIQLQLVIRGGIVFP